MTPLERRYLMMVVYLLGLASGSALAIQISSEDIVPTAGLVLALFLLGWFSFGLSEEHIKSKARADVEDSDKPKKPSGPDEEEQKWRSLLHKKEPWEP